MNFYTGKLLEDITNSAVKSTMILSKIIVSDACKSDTREVYDTLLMDADSMNYYNTFRTYFIDIIGRHSKLSSMDLSNKYMKDIIDPLTIESNCTYINNVSLYKFIEMIDAIRVELYHQKQNDDKRNISTKEADRWIELFKPFEDIMSSCLSFLCETHKSQSL